MGERVKRRPTPKQAADLMAEWEHVPVGSDVVLTLDDGTERATRTRSAPWLLGDGSPVVILVEGKSGGWALERLRKA